MGKAYDAIIVGARCAGSPTAMLLARCVDASVQNHFNKDTDSPVLASIPGKQSASKFTPSKTSRIIFGGNLQGLFNARSCSLKCHRKKV